MPNLAALLISLALSLSLVVGGLHTFTKYHGTLEARTTLRKLDYTISLAKSIALTSHEELMICPRQGGQWSKGWQIQTARGKILKTIHAHVYALIHFKAYPAGSLCIKVLPTGMSYNNGHFTYRSRSLLYTVQRNLFFNQGLRTYYD